MIYWFPNRPYLIEPTHPKVLELSNDPNWFAELKQNGDRLVLQKHSNPTPWKRFEGFVFASRHKDYLKRFEPVKSLLDELKSLSLPDNTQLDGELMHFKTKHIKFKIIFYDIYVLGGKQIQETLETRRAILTDILSKDNHWGKYNHLSLSTRYDTGFPELFTESIKRPEIEGLVMKDKNGRIVWNTCSSNDVTWQVKIRRKSANYLF